MIVACALAFMPLLNGQAFAAAKKPGKVTVKSVKQVSGTYNVKVTWKKATNAKKYNVKVGSKTYKNKKGTSLTVKNLAAGTYKVKVQGVNGKKKGAWSAAKKVTVKAPAEGVKITGEALVGENVTAVVYDNEGKAVTEGVTYQWYRVSKTEELAIANATAAEYVPTDNDNGCSLYVIATVGGQAFKSSETAKVAQNVQFFVALDATATEKGHTAPVVGDTLKIGEKRDGSFTNYVESGYDAIKWLADGQVINGAKGYSYQVTKYEVGKAISAELTKNNVDGTKTVITVVASEKVVESVLPTAGRVVGMTVPATYDKKTGELVPGGEGIPAVGDTLNVEFTKPAGAADPDATYQWTRNGAAISGATTATYTVKQADFGKILAVKVTNADGGAVTMEALESVCTNISSAVVVVNDTTPTINENNKVKSVKLGDDPLTVGTNCTAVWYVDSVSEENVIYDASHNEVSEIKKNTQYFLVKDPAAKTLEYKETTLVGHTLIATVKGEAASGFVGTAASAATPVVTATITDVSITPDITPITTASTLTATAVAVNNHISGKPDVSYKWYKKVGADGEFTEIEGATAATYEPTAAEQGENVTAYRVAIAGSDLYKVVEGERKSYYDYTVVWGDPEAAKFVTFTVTNANEEHCAATPAPGDELSIAASIAKAENTMTYTWTLKDNEGTKVEEKTGATYTVPTTAKKGYTATVVPTNTNSAFTISTIYDGNVTPAAVIANGTVTVQGLITKVELVSNGTKLVNYLPTGKPEDDHVANPQVKTTVEYLAANVTAEVSGDSTTGITKNEIGYTFSTVKSKAVTPELVDTNGTYQWYADGEAISGANDSKLAITSAYLGKKISVKVTGGAGYAGAEAISDESGAVIVYGEITLSRKGYGPAEPMDKNAQLALKSNRSGTTYTYTAGLTVAGVSDVEYTVTDVTDGRVIADTASFQLTEKEIGHIIEVTATGTGLVEKEAGDLTWSSDLVVVEQYD